MRGGVRIKTAGDGAGNGGRRNTYPHDTGAWWLAASSPHRPCLRPNLRVKHQLKQRHAHTDMVQSSQRFLHPRLLRPNAIACTFVLG